jgi:hypothetical protein
MLIQKHYDDVRNQMLPGDVLAFGGKGRFSDLIKWVSNGVVSHVGIVINNVVAFNQVVESATINGFSGVSTNFVYKRILEYDGELWWFPLRDKVRRKLDIGAMQKFLLEQDGKHYDLRQAVVAGLGLIKNDENFDEFFCSEIVAAGLEAGGIVSLNASMIMPIDVCKLDIYSDDYYQIKGPEMEVL